VVRVLHRMKHQSIRLLELHQSVQVIVSDGQFVDSLRRGCENGYEESTSVCVWDYGIVFVVNGIVRASQQSQL
jgi:hypothetical protein